MNWIKSSNPLRILAVSLGFCYFWFGVLKFFPGASPAENLAKETISIMTFGIIPASTSILLLAIWETIIGILFIANYINKPLLIIALVHICLTFSPLLLLPELAFNGAAHLPTLLGQYIAKNVVFISGFLILLKDLD